MCQRAGISWADNLVIGSDNNIIASSKDSTTWINDQSILRPFRGRFSYRNVAFDIAGKVIENVSGRSNHDFVQKRIFDPLGMSRSFLKTPAPDIDNVSKCYNALVDLSTTPITCSRAGDDWHMAATAGLRSCVSDLMKLYSAFGTCFNDQFTNGTSKTEGLPLKQIPELMSVKIPMDQPTRNELSYALG